MSDTDEGDDATVQPFAVLDVPTIATASACGRASIATGQRVHPGGIS